MKHPMVKISALSASIFAASSAMAGGFDNSSRDFNIIYGDNNVITTSYGQTAVPMKAQIQQGAGNTSSVVASGEILDDFQRPQMGFRYQIANDVTCAAQYEKPFAAKVSYKDDSLAYGSETAPISTTYESESFTVACGYDFALSTGKIKVFGGPKIQKVEGAFDEDLSTAAAGANDNLDVQLDGGSEFGYILGAAYEIPEYALRASILYHSQIDYDASGEVSAVLPAALGPLGGTPFTTDATAKTFTPQTVELALQSGIAENTLAFIKMRWSEYSKLAELQVNGDTSTVVGGATLAQLDASATQQTNNQRTANGLDPVACTLCALYSPNVSMFSNDTFDYSFGLGRRVNDQLSLGASFSGSIKLGGKSSDTPIGADSTSLRLPGDTSHTLSFGGEYTVIPKLKVSGGFGYTFINDYVVQTTADQDTGLSAYRAEFDKTEATSFQLGLTYEI